MLRYWITHNKRPESISSLSFHPNTHTTIFPQIFFAFAPTTQFTSLCCCYFSVFMRGEKLPNWTLWIVQRTILACVTLMCPVVAQFHLLLCSGQHCRMAMETHRRGPTRTNWKIEPLMGGNRFTVQFLFFMLLLFFFALIWRGKTFIANHCMFGFSCSTNNIQYYPFCLKRVLWGQWFRMTIVHLQSLVNHVRYVCLTESTSLHHIHLLHILYIEIRRRCCGNDIMWPSLLRYGW